MVSFESSFKKPQITALSPSRVSFLAHVSYMGAPSAKGRLPLFGLTPDFDAIFHVIFSLSTQMKMLQIIDWRSLGKFGEFILLKLQTCRYSVQTASLLQTDFPRDYFRNMFWKLAFLIRIFWEKCLWCTMYLYFSKNVVL